MTGRNPIGLIRIIKEEKILYLTPLIGQRTLNSQPTHSAIWLNRLRFQSNLPDMKTIKIIN